MKSQKSLQMDWRSDMGVEPTQDGITAPQTVLKTATVTGPHAAPLGAPIFARSPGAVSAGRVTHSNLPDSFAWGLRCRYPYQQRENCRGAAAAAGPGGGG